MEKGQGSCTLFWGILLFLILVVLWFSSNVCPQILGVILNMSHLTCPCCKTEIPIFPSKISSLLAESDIPLLASIPLNPDIAECSDQGRPIVLTQPECLESLAYLEAAKGIIQKMGIRSVGSGL